MKKSLSIFGGSGFLGKSFYDSFSDNFLKKFGIDELNLVSRSAVDKFKYNKNKNIKAYNFDFSNNIGQLPERTDYIINAVDHASYDFYEDGFSNDQIIENVINISKKKYNNPNTLYISSGAVYGEQTEFSGFKEEFNNPDFTNFTKQKKKYAISKTKFEKAYKNISNNNCKNVIARCFTFIGSNVPLDQHFAIGNFYNSVFKKNRIKILSKMNIYRSYMDAYDLVNWLLTVFLENKKDYDIFNIGAKEHIEIEELAKIFKDIFKIDFERSNGKSDKMDIYLPNIEKATKLYKLDYEKNLKYLIENNFKKIQL